MLECDAGNVNITTTGSFQKVTQTADFDHTIENLCKRKPMHMHMRKPMHMHTDRPAETYAPAKTYAHR